jgi:hypothetical protein
MDLGFASYDEVVGVGIEAGDQETRRGAAPIGLHRGHIGQAVVDQPTVVEGTARFDHLDLELGVMPPSHFRDGLHELKAFARPRASGDDETLFPTGIEVDVCAGTSEEQHEQGHEEYVESFQHLFLHTACHRLLRAPCHSHEACHPARECTGGDSVDDSPTMLLDVEFIAGSS